MNANSPSLFTVFVDDNFHYQDEEERYIFGEFESYQEALCACRKIVDDSLNHLLSEKPDCTEAQLYDRYTSFGNDPFIRPQPNNTPAFSAWHYAKERCQVFFKG